MSFKVHISPGVKSVRILSYYGPHFLVFGLNSKNNEVSLHIQSECGKMRSRITPNTDMFNAVSVNHDILKLFTSMLRIKKVPEKNKTVNNWYVRELTSTK